MEGWEGSDAVPPPRDGTACKVWYHRHCMDIPSEVLVVRMFPGSAKNVNVSEYPCATCVPSTYIV